MNADLYFWDREQLIVLPGPLPIILVRDKPNFLGEWPGKDVPSLDDIHEELGNARVFCASWNKSNDGGSCFINLLVGRLLVRCLAAPSSSGPQQRLRMTKQGVQLATQRMRMGVLQKGARVQADGIRLVDGRTFGNQFEPKTYYGSGQYVESLTSAPPEENAPAAGPQKDGTTTPSMRNALDMLQALTEAAQEVEEEEIRAEAPFAFYQCRAEPHSGNLQQLFRLTFPDNDYRRLVEKQPSLLELMDPSDGKTILFRVVSIAAGTSQILISGSRQIHMDELPETGEVRLAALPIMKRVRESVINRLASGTAPNRWLLPVLTDSFPFSGFASTPVPAVPGSRPLPSQQTAIDCAAASPDLFLVLGPPGTGKTTVIQAWVRHLVTQGKRILVTSQNNKAVDNVLERLARDQKITCVRVGQEHKVATAIHPLLIDNKAHELQERLADRLRQVMTDAQALSTWLGALPDLVPTRDTLRQRIAELEQRQTASADVLKQAARDADGKRKAQDAARQHLLKQEAEEKKLAQRQRARGFIGGVVLGLVNAVIDAFSKPDVDGARKALAMAEAAHNAAARFQRDQQTAAAILESTLTEARQQLAVLIEPCPALSLPRSVLPASDFPRSATLEQCRAALSRTNRLRKIIDDWRCAILESRQETLYSQLLASVDVVGATCIGIQTSAEFRDIDFDMVIVDESGQIQVHDMIVPLTRAPRAILVGDHKQLPPVVKDRFHEALLSRDVNHGGIADASWFEFLWRQLPHTRRARLDTQFRCPAVISDFNSKAFYDGEYHAAPGVRTEPLLTFFTSPLVFIDTSNHPDRQEQTQVSTAGLREITGNRLETALVVEVLSRAVAEREELLRDIEGIGVIAPYKRHVEQIRQALKLKSRSDAGLAELGTTLSEIVATVDSFQGQERHLIILAMTRSNHMGAVGPLHADWRRLNVAMTRTKHQLVIIGDLSTLTRPARQRDGEGSRDEEFKSAMRQLKAHIEANGQMMKAADILRQGA